MICMGVLTLNTYVIPFVNECNCIVFNLYVSPNIYKSSVYASSMVLSYFKLLYCFLFNLNVFDSGCFPEESYDRFPSVRLHYNLSHYENFTRQNWLVGILEPDMLNSENTKRGIFVT